MTTPRITADDALPVVRVEVTGDINTERVVVGVADQPRVTVTNTGEAITVRIATTAAGVNSVNGAQGDVTVTTTTIAEGTNQYYTTARARSAITAGTGITYNNTSGVVSNIITQYTDAMARSAVTVTDAGGDGSLSYNNTTGVITYTGPSSSEVRAQLSAGTGLTYAAGQFAVDTSTIATRSYADSAAASAAAAVVNSAPGTLDTLNELALALGNDANFATTITNSIGTKLATSAFTSTANTWQATRTTDNLTEGSTNLYFTNQRAIDAVGTNWSGPSGIINSGRWNSPYTQNSVLRGFAQWAAGGTNNFSINNTSSVNDLTALNVSGWSTHTQPLQKWTASSTTVASISTGGVVTADSVSLTTYPTTTNITEGTRLYYTDARARAAVSASTGITYNSSTGVIACSITQYTDALAQAAITAGTGVTVSGGAVAIGQAVGTAADVVFNSVDANITDGNTVLGQLIATRNTSWTPPSSGLSTITGSNGLAVASSTGYNANISATYYAGDTTAGTNTSAAFIGRGASGTNSSPTAASSGQVLSTFNVDGYATTGWAQSIATSGSGAGTTAISPAQLQFYTREAFADSSGSVTNAGTGMRVRLFNTATTMSTANRVNIIDHTTATATYKAATFNIQASATATNYAVFASGGSTIGGVDGANNITRVRGASAGVSPSLILKNSNTVSVAPATGDGTAFRLATTGSNATTYTIADIGAQYSTAGDNQVNISIASGDQTSGTFTGLVTLQSKITSTTISAGTASGTAGASAVSAKLTIDAAKVTAAVPVAYPSYTTAQRDALTPAAGWVLWNSTLTKLQVYTGSAWQDLN